MSADSDSKSLLPPSLRWAGPALSAAYACGVSLHRTFSSPRWAPLPTIVIGNITVGGTGKTPMTIYLGERLLRAGERPAVLIRGYKGQASDEAYEIRNAFPPASVPVIIGSNRYASAVIATEQGCSVALLDDGFQHWALNRDLDIVLIDASRPFGGEKLVPEGRLREPPSGLARAGAIVITRSDSVPREQLDALRRRVRELAPGATLATSRHRPNALREVSADARMLPLDRLREGKFSPVCGIGNPHAFERTLKALGANLTSLQALPDHFKYTADTLREIVLRARNEGSSAIVTTAKDAVKIAVLPGTTELPIYELSVRMEFLSGEEELWARVRKAIAYSRHWVKARI